MYQQISKYQKKQYSNLAKTGASILQSNVKPFMTEREPIPSSKYSLQKQQYPKLIKPHYNPSAILTKLTLKRLRKIQALVRGFITRRTTYPRLLKQYKICQKVYQSICLSCILQQSSGIVLELISQNKVSNELTLQSKHDRLLHSLTDSFMDQVIQQMSKQIIATCISDNIQKTKPDIKALTSGNTHNIYRLNLPEQKIAKEMIELYIDKISEPLAKQVIKEVVDQLRMQKLAQQYIMMQKLVEPFVEQILRQYMNQMCIEELSGTIINEVMEQFSETLVTYQIQKHQKQLKGMAVRQIETNLSDLIIGQRLLELILLQEQ